MLGTSAFVIVGVVVFLENTLCSGVKAEPNHTAGHVTTITVLGTLAEGPELLMWLWLLPTDLVTRSTISCSHTTIISVLRLQTYQTNMIMPQHRSSVSSSVSSLGSTDSIRSNSSSSIPFTANEGEFVAPVEGLRHVGDRLEAR